MQKSFIASLILLGTAPALAGSFEQEHAANAQSRSIMTIGCPQCAAAKSKEDRAAKMLPPGTEINEIHEVDGQMMLYTTENWLGGNPVTIVRKAHALDIAKYSPEDSIAPKNAIAKADIADDNSDIEAAAPITANAASEVIDLGVDEEAKTAALPETPKELDVSKFELRIE